MIVKPVCPEHPDAEVQYVEVVEAWAATRWPGEKVAVDYGRRNVSIEAREWWFECNNCTRVLPKPEGLADAIQLVDSEQWDWL